MPWTHKPAENNHRLLISHCRHGQSFLTWYCDVTIVDLRRHVNPRCWYFDVIFVDCFARTNWRKVDLRKWITTVNIDLSPPGIHDWACKKRGVSVHSIPGLSDTIDINVFYTATCLLNRVITGPDFTKNTINIYIPLQYKHYLYWPRYKRTLPNIHPQLFTKYKFEQILPSSFQCCT